MGIGKEDREEVQAFKSSQRKTFTLKDVLSGSGPRLGGAAIRNSAGLRHSLRPD